VLQGQDVGLTDNRGYQGNLTVIHQSFYNLRGKESSFGLTYNDPLEVEINGMPNRISSMHD